MEREKMIEKIARIICENGTVDCFCPEPQRVACTAYNKARDILTSIIPDGAFVLTREQQIADIKANTIFVDKERENARKETAMKIYRELMGHGTTYVKKWIIEHYGIEVK